MRPAALKVRHWTLFIRIRVASRRWPTRSPLSDRQLTIRSTRCLVDRKGYRDRGSIVVQFRAQIPAQLQNPFPHPSKTHAHGVISWQGHLSVRASASLLNLELHLTQRLQQANPGPSTPRVAKHIREAFLNHSEDRNFQFGIQPSKVRVTFQTDSDPAALSESRNVPLQRPPETDFIQ